MADPGETAWLDELQIRLTVDDARTAQVAGVTFARRLFGAHSGDFTLALAEQKLLVEHAIVETGHSAEQARLTGWHFAVAACDEWTRLAGANDSHLRGTA
jgi:hypothetical protein